MITSPASTADASRGASRRKVWGALAVLLVAAVVLLVLAVSSRDEDPAATDPGIIRFRVVNEQGQPVSHAEVFLLASEDLPAGGSGEWLDAEATLLLPTVARGSAIAVQARGYRSEVVQDVIEDREFVLRHGFLIRVEARGADAAALGDAVLVFQVIPEPTGDRTAEQLAKIADLIATLVPPPDGRIRLPRGEFGFAVRAEMAKQGLLLPLAGRYGVRWGLLDPASRLYFALPEETRAVIGVTDDPRTQLFEIPVTAEALVQTRKGLLERVRGIQPR